MARGIRLIVLVASLFVPPSVAGAQPFIRSAVPDEANQTLTISGLNVGPAPPLVLLDLQSLEVLSVSGAQVVTALPPGRAPGTYSLILVQGSEFALSEVTLGGAGSLTAPPLGDAVDFRSFASAPLSLAASSFRATTATEEQQTFVWRVDPVGHNTKNPSARLNLLFAPGGGLPLPTGLGIHEDGTFSSPLARRFPAPSRTYRRDRVCR
ncbi:MAG: hypothetical protein ACRD3V_18155 [Vicinamibacteria bacterium]